jgi:hypothetical protein
MYMRGPTFPIPIADATANPNSDIIQTERKKEKGTKREVFMGRRHARRPAQTIKKEKGGI